MLYTRVFVLMCSSSSAARALCSRVSMRSDFPEGIIITLVGLFKLTRHHPIHYPFNVFDRSSVCPNMCASVMSEDCNVDQIQLFKALILRLLILLMADSESLVTLASSSDSVTAL